MLTRNVKSNKLVPMDLSLVHAKVMSDFVP
jgi:hypothetical protein